MLSFQKERVRHLARTFLSVGDLVLVLSLSLGAAFVFLGQTREIEPVRRLLGIALVFALPGYGFVSLLFPAVDVEFSFRETVLRSTGEGVGDSLAVERFALSVLSSAIIAVLVGMVLNYSPVGIRRTPFVVGIISISCVLSLLAIFNRLRYPTDVRYQPSFPRVFPKTGQTGANFRRLLSVLLALSLVLSITAMAYSLAFPVRGETYTEFYALSESDQGELVASNYPDDFDDNDGIVLGIENNEKTPVNYTVVVQAQRVAQGNDSARVTDRETVARHSVVLEAGEMEYLRSTPQLTMRGQDRRLAFLLYRGDSPENPSTENAYRSLHFWLNETESTEG